MELGERHGGIRADHPEEADRALLRESHHLHDVRRRRPARDRQRIDVPVPRELLDVVEVLPVQHRGKVAVRAGLARVLRGRLAVHLEDRAAWAADHPAEQVDVVHLARGCSRLVRLVDALQARRDEPLRGADDASRLSDVFGRNAADVGGDLRRILRDHLLEVGEADGVRFDERAIDGAVRDQLVLDRVEEREVRAVADRQMDRRLLGDLRPARIDDNDARRVRSSPPVEDPHPQDGVRLGDVVADREDRVAVVEVGERPRLAVGAERLLEREVGGRRAQARVSVEVRRPDAGADDERERVVVL